MAPWYSWLVRRPVTPKVTGSSPVGVVTKLIYVVLFGRIAQLGERLPYKQDVIGSSPIVSTTKSQLKRLTLFLLLIIALFINRNSFFGHCK